MFVDLEDGQSLILVYDVMYGLYVWAGDTTFVSCLKLMVFPHSVCVLGWLVFS